MPRECGAYRSAPNYPDLASSTGEGNALSNDEGRTRRRNPRLASAERQQAMQERPHAGDGVTSGRRATRAARGGSTGKVRENVVSMDHPLNDSLARLDRAHEHLHELRTLHQQVLAAQGAATVVGMPTEMSIGGMVGTAVPITSGQIEIPPRLSILVGDVANGLRSALDYLVGELALLDSGSRHRSQFPVFTSQDHFSR